MPAERLDSFDPGIGGLVQLAGGHDDRLGLVGLPAGGLDAPAALGVREAAGGHLRAGQHQAVDPEVAGDLVEIAEDVGLRGAQPRPVAPLREGERVEVRGDVAGGARVVVVEPGATEVRGGVEDRDIAEAVLLQLDRRGDPAEAGTDDEDP